MDKWYPLAYEPIRKKSGGDGGEPQIAVGPLLEGNVKARGGVRIGHGCAIKGNVEIGQGVRIGHGCVIEGDVEIGQGTRIDHHAVVRGRVRLGTGNWIYPFCAIGTGPQHSRHLEDISADPAAGPARGEIRIGSGNVIREYTTVHLPTVDERTSIGSGCHILAYSHIAHDCHVGDGVTMTNGATLGGHCTVGERANLGLNVSVHPFCRIGRYAMVGMMNPVVKDVPPYALVNRQRFAKVNRVGMERGGMGEEDIRAVEAAYAGIESGARRAAGGAAYREITEFLEGSKKGFYPPDGIYGGGAG